MVRDIEIVCLFILISVLVYLTLKIGGTRARDGVQVPTRMPDSAIVSADLSNTDLRAAEFSFRGDGGALRVALVALFAMLVPWLFVWRKLGDSLFSFLLLSAPIVETAVTYASIYRWRLSHKLALLTVALAVEVELIYFVPIFAGYRAVKTELYGTAILVLVVILTCNLMARIRRKDMRGSFAADNCRYDGSNMSGICLQDAILARSSFVSANLSWANLGRAIISDCDFRRSNLSNINLRGAKINGTNFGSSLATNWLNSPVIVANSNFDGCILAGSSFRRAMILNCTFVGADLIGTDFEGSRFNNVNFKGATADSRTKWPKNADPELLGVTVKA